MATTTTLNKGLIKPTPGTKEPIKIADINANSDAVDAGFARIVFDVTDPRWAGGAKGDGATDDHIAIQAAFDYAALGAAAHSSNTPVGNAATPVVYFPPGRYKLGSAVTITSSYAFVEGGGGAVVLPSSSVVDAFLVSAAFRLSVRGITVVGGRHGFDVTTNNVDSSRVDFDTCEFLGLAGYAVRTTGSNSTLLTMRRCKAIASQVLYNTCDLAIVQDCWVETQTVATPFYNAQGVLQVVGLCGVPGASLAVWIDNRGNVDIDRSRFGGETGANTVVAHHGAGFLKLRNSYAYALSGPIIKLYDLPTHLVIEGNDGQTSPVNGLMQLDSGVTGLGTIARTYWNFEFRWVIRNNVGYWWFSNLDPDYFAGFLETDWPITDDQHDDSNYFNYAGAIDGGGWTVASNNVGILTTTAPDGQTVRRLTVIGATPTYTIQLNAGMDAVIAQPGVYTLSFLARTDANGAQQGARLTLLRLDKGGRDLPLSTEWRRYSVSFWWDAAATSGSNNRLGFQVNFGLVPTLGIIDIGEFALHKGYAVQPYQFPLNALPGVVGPTWPLFRGVLADITGTFKVGDIVINKTPVAGGKIGWVCTTAGSPGTFKAFGVIDA